MGGGSGGPGPHLSVKREVLVRYLDAWTPVALRSHRGATFIESGGFAGDALRVFGETADLLDGRHLEVVLVGTAVPAVPGELAAQEGFSVRSVAESEGVKAAGTTLLHVDAVEGGDVWRLVESLGRGKGREVLLALPATTPVTDCRRRLAAAGLPCVAAVELVADDEQAQLLVFGTAESKRLGIFKNELWAVDEFAGIRYRDPHDAEGALVDISLTPQLLPLRRELLAELARRRSCTVGELQQYALLETIYRPADVIGALTSAASAGAITREPAKGRLTPATVVS